MLCYVIYYFSFILTSYRLWLWNSVEKGFNVSIQRQIIVTVIELLNSLAESNIDSEKNYMNMRFYSRFKNNLDTVYKDSNLLDRIKERSNSRIKVKDKKVIYTLNKVNTISLDGIFKKKLMHRNQKEVCQSKTFLMKKTKKNKINNEISSLTHCSDGRFHKWEIKDKELVCSLCKKRYNSLKNVDTSSDNDTKDILNNIRWNLVRKLVNKYCISGEKHDIDKKTGICKKCKINPESYQYKIKDLKELDKNLAQLKMEEDLNNIKKMNKMFKKKVKYQEKVNSLLLKLNNKFDKQTKEGKFESKFVNYIDKFVDKLEDVVGKRISDEDNVIYLKDNIFIIDHDYLGNPIKNPIKVLSSNKKIKKEINHNFFKMDVLYYQDRSKSVYVYYNSVSLHYLGYSQDNKKFIKLRTRSSLKINYSLFSMLSLVGFDNVYINLTDIDKKYVDVNVKPTKKELDFISKYVFSERITNIKTIINKVHTMINQIKFNKDIKYESIYNNIINSFQNKLKNFNTESDEGKRIFKHKYDYFTNIEEIDISFDEININRNYIRYRDINRKNQYDTKLIFYLVNNLMKLIEYNTNRVIKTAIGYLIIKIIKYIFDSTFIDHNKLEIRKFTYYLYNEPAYVNESIKSTDHYTEILNQTEIDDLNKLNNVKNDMEISGYYNELMTPEEMLNEDVEDINYDIAEEMDALDIDDNNDNLFGDVDEEEFNSFDVDNL